MLTSAVGAKNAALLARATAKVVILQFSNI